MSDGTMARIARRMAARHPQAAAKGLLDAGVIGDVIGTRHANTNELIGGTVYVDGATLLALCDASTEDLAHYHDDNECCEEPDCFECSVGY